MSVMRGGNRPLSPRRSRSDAGKAVPAEAVHRRQACALLCAMLLTVCAASLLAGCIAMVPGTLAFVVPAEATDTYSAAWLHTQQSTHIPPHHGSCRSCSPRACTTLTGCCINGSKDVDGVWEAVYLRRLGLPRHLGLPTWDGHPLKYTGTSLLVVLLQAPLKQCLCCHGQLEQVLLEDIVHTSCRTHSVSLLHHLLSHRGSMSAFGWSLLQVPSSSSTARAVGLYSYVPHVC